VDDYEFSSVLEFKEASVGETAVHIERDGEEWATVVHLRDLGVTVRLVGSLDFATRARVLAPVLGFLIRDLAGDGLKIIGDAALADDA
jgi:hypothetical protein